jgi:hypothetical protein
METDDFIRALKPDQKYERMFEVMQTALIRMSGQIEQLMGPQASGTFKHTIATMQAGLQAEIDTDMSFRAVFSGYGPVANRLREFANLEQVLYGEHLPDDVQVIAQTLTRFNYSPTDNPARVAEWHAFKSRVEALLSQKNDRIAPVVEFEPTAIRDVTTGFFVESNTHRGQRKHLALAGVIPGTQVRYVFQAATFAHPVLVCYHPLEQAWVSPGEQLTLSGLIGALYDELAEATDKLEESHGERDWVEEYLRLMARAQELLATRARHLPPVMRSFSRDKQFPQASQISVQHRDYTLIVRNTAGEYPSFSGSVYTGDLKEMAFQQPFESLAPNLQRQLAIAFARELDYLDDQVAKHAPKPILSFTPSGFSAKVIKQYGYVHKPEKGPDGG